MHYFNKTILRQPASIAVIFGILLVVPFFVSAQTSIIQVEDEIIPIQPILPEPPTCPRFIYTLSFGSTDATTNGEVSKLQQFLAQDPGVYPEGIVTGYYGSLTETAVKRWQAKNGVVSSGTPASTGYGVVGPQTRDKILIICPIPPVPPTNAGVTVVSPNGGEVWQKGTTQKIAWSLSTASGGGSGRVTPLVVFPVDIYLFQYQPPCLVGPCPSPPAFNTIASSVLGSVYNWTVSDFIEKINVPDGKYIIRVQRTGTAIYDDSDAPFSIVSKGGNLPPVIRGVSGPQTLQVGEAGKWMVKASDPEGGTLSYTVVWGDENPRLPGEAVVTAPLVPGQDVTFTHTYNSAAVYTPTFTVNDSGGLSVKTSISVNVGGATKNSPPKIGTGDAPEEIRVGERATFSWQATDADGDDLVWSVSWGDGTGVGAACSVNPFEKSPATVFPPPKSWNFSATHAWAKAGTYLVTVTVNDCKGGQDSSTLVVTVDGNDTLSQNVLTIADQASSAFRLGAARQFSQLSQSFKAPSGNITGVILGLAKRNNPTYPITVSIRESLNGPDLTSAVITPAQISTDYRDPTHVEVSFPNVIAFTPGKTYYLTLSVDTVNTRNFYWWSIDDRNNPYVDGNFFRQENAKRRHDAVAKILYSLSAPPIKQDIQRISDIKKLQQALELYYEQNQREYPLAHTTCAGDRFYGLEVLVSGGFISKIPQDVGSNTPCYYYASVAKGGAVAYHLGAQLQDVTHSALNTDRDCNSAVASSCKSGEPSYTNGFFGIDPVYDVASPSITVISPNGGEVWEFGKPNTISWQSAGVKDLSIYLWFSDGGTCKLTDTVASAGSYLVTLKEKQLCPNIPKNVTAGEYRISIWTNVEGIKDASDAPFSIVTQSGSGIDFTVENVSIQSGNVGEEVILNFNIMNRGNETFFWEKYGRGVQWTVDYLNAANGYNSKGRIISDGCNIPINVVPGAGCSVKMGITFTEPGAKTIPITADFANLVPEVNEGNNTEKITTVISSSTADKKYDLNNDRKIDYADIQLLTDVILGQKPSLPKMDVNGDGKTNLFDLLETIDAITEFYDINGDGKADGNDYEVVVNVVSGNQACPTNKDCDLNGDGVITTADATMVILFVANIQRPVITSITPSSGPVGTQVTLKGAGFSNAGNVVTYAFSRHTNVPAITTSTGEQAIIFTIEDNPVGSYKVQATNARGGLSNTVVFTITGKLTQGTSVNIQKSADALGGTVVPGVGNQIIGGFHIAVTGEPVNVSSVKFAFRDGIVPLGSNVLSNIRLYDPQGKIVAGPVDLPLFGSAAGTLVFTDNFTVPVGTHDYSLKANIGSAVGAGTTITVSTIPSNYWSVHGQTSGAVITASPNAEVKSNTYTVAVGALAVVKDASSPSNQTVAAGSLNVPALMLKVSATNEAIRLDQLGLEFSGLNRNAVGKITLWDGATKVGEHYLNFDTTSFVMVPVTPVTIPADGFKVLTVKADINPIARRGSSDGDRFTINYDGGSYKDTFGTSLTSGFRVTSSTRTDTNAGVITVGNKSSLAYGKLAVPTVDLPLGASADTVLYRFSVTAPAASPGFLSLFPFNLTKSGATTPVGLTLYAYADSAFSFQAYDQNPVRSGTVILGDSRDVEMVFDLTQLAVPAGTTRYFELQASFSEVGAGDSVTTGFRDLPPQTLTAPVAPAATELIIADRGTSGYKLGANNKFEYLSQSFMPPKSGLSVTGVSVGLSKRREPLYPIIVSIRESLDGLNLATGVITPDQVQSTKFKNPDWIDVDFEKYVSVVREPGKLYYLVLSVSTIDGGDFYRWSVAENNPYNGGEFFREDAVKSRDDSVAKIRFVAGASASGGGGGGAEPGASSVQSQNYASALQAIQVRLDRMLQTLQRLQR